MSIAPPRLVPTAHAHASGVFDLALICRHGPRLLATAQRLLVDEVEAGDAVRDAFAAAFASGAERLHEADAWRLLHRLVIRAAAERVLARPSAADAPLDRLLPRFASDGSWLRPPMAVPPVGESASARAHVRRRISELPDRHRLVLLLYDIERLSAQEVAALTGDTVVVVKRYLHEARQACVHLFATPAAHGPAPAGIQAAVPGRGRTGGDSTMGCPAPPGDF